MEVKLGQHRLEEGAKSLLRVVDHVDTARHGAPAFTAVVTVGRRLEPWIEGISVP